MPSHSKQARTHEEARMAVCCICGKKPKGSSTTKPILVLSDKQMELVKMIREEYNFHNPMHPTGLCLTCNITLTAIKMVNDYMFQYITIFKMINLYCLL